MGGIPQPVLEPSDTQGWDVIWVDRYELVFMFKSVLAKMAPWPSSWISLIAVSTMSYETVQSAVGMQELMNSPSNGAEGSCMTQNLHEAFLAHRPSGEMTYAGKTGPLKGPIIIFAFSSFSNFVFTASQLARAFLLLPFTHLLLCSLSFTIWWTGRSSLRRKYFFPKPFHQIV